jgi:Tol biopolymer transport system component
MVAAGVQFNRTVSRAAFNVSEAGLLAYQIAGPQPGFRLRWMSRDGKPLEWLSEPGTWGTYSGPLVSPDGKQVLVAAVEERTGNNDLWMYDVARGTRTRLTTDPGNDNEPVFSPSGEQIIFSCSRDGTAQLCVRDSGGVREPELILESAQSKYASSWSLDRKNVMFSSQPSGPLDLGFAGDLWVLPMHGERKPFAWLATPFNETGGTFSPDGEWVAYASNEGGTMEIYIAPFPGPGRKWRVSAVGGEQPSWSPDGRELFFLSGERVMSAAVDLRSAEPKISTPQELFEFNRSPVRGRSYTYDSRNKRFLLNTAGEGAAPPIVLITNWQANLKK